MTKIERIKSKVKDECQNLGFTKDWFYETHLLAVEKFAKELLKQLPEADNEIVLLGAWLHDLQRVRGVKGDHAGIGAREAEKVMKQFKFSEEKINRVKDVILTHSCDTNIMPQTLEGKILASADAMSHYVNDFYLQIAVTGERDLPSFKEWALEKLDRDFNKKIFFDFAKKMIKKRHNILVELFTMK